MQKQGSNDFKTSWELQIFDIFALKFAESDSWFHVICFLMFENNFLGNISPKLTQEQKVLISIFNLP